MNRVIAGFLIAPSLTPVCIFLLGLAFGSPGEAVAWSILFAVLCYSSALIFGYPAFRLMNSRGWLKKTHFLIGGALAGPVFGVIGLLETTRLGVAMFLIAGAGGATSALIFWYMVVHNGLPYNKSFKVDA